MSLTNAQIFALSDKERRRFRFIPERRGRYRKEVRPKRTPEELIDWLRANDIHKIRDVSLKRKPGDPTISDYRLAFAKWKDALDRAFGFQMPKPNVDDAEYMAKVVTQLGIWTLEDYIDARKKRPDIVPCYKALTKRWGGFRRLKFLCQRYSFVAVFNEYLKLRRRLGHLPTTDECKDNNVVLDKAIQHFGSRKKMDAFIDSMERKA